MLWSFVLGRVHWKPAPKPMRGPSSSPNLSGLIRRAMSCPRSISSLTAQSPTNETRRPKTATHMANASTVAAQTAATMTQMTPIRPHTACRSHSLSRNSSTNRVPHSSSLGAIHPNTASIGFLSITHREYLQMTKLLVLFMQNVPCNSICIDYPVKILHLSEFAIYNQCTLLYVELSIPQSNDLTFHFQEVPVPA